MVALSITTSIYSLLLIYSQARTPASGAMPYSIAHASPRYIVITLVIFASADRPGLLSPISLEL